MRLFIFKITYGEWCPTYDFTRTARTAWFWSARDEAGRACRLISRSGITINLTHGNPLHCADFRVEERPQGGFAISCEHPCAGE
jgi:hypothetical protein